MKVPIIACLMASALMICGASAANQYVEVSAKLEDVISNSLGLATFRPSVIMTDSQMHITLSPTLLEITQHQQMLGES